MAIAAVLGGLCGNPGGKEEGGTAAGRRRPAPGSPGELGGGGRGGRGSPLPSRVTQWVSSRRLRSGALPPVPEPGVGGAACRRAPLEDAAAPALEPW